MPKRGNLRRLRRLESVLPQPAPLPAPAPTAQAEEAHVLAAEVAQAFGQLVRQYQEGLGLTPEEAVARADDTTPEEVRRLLTCPPGRLGWFDLAALSRHDPDKALARWEEVKRAAQEDVRTGYHASRVLETHDGTCAERARFLAVRAELSESLRPRSALEQQLVDQLGQWQVLLWDWQQVWACHVRALGGPRAGATREGHPLEPPRLSDAEVIERALATVERLHGLYLRTLKALQEQRRCPAVVVRRAGQVNLAHQQLNLGG